MTNIAFAQSFLDCDLPGGNRTSGCQLGEPLIATCQRRKRRITDRGVYRLPRKDQSKHQTAGILETPEVELEDFAGKVDILVGTKPEARIFVLPAHYKSKIFHQGLETVWPLFYAY